MHIVLGAAGHTGFAVVRSLRDRGEPVTAVIHHEAKAEPLRGLGAEVEVLDVRDSERLRQVLRRGRTLFLLNPPAAPATDTDREERATLRAILSAVEGSGLQRVVAQSTYGAQPGGHLGDLGVLYEMEEALAQQAAPTQVVRAAYLMSNWLPYVKPAREQGVLNSFFPTEFALPMVAPEDLGRYAAELLTEPGTGRGLVQMEGPRRYTPADVAAALGATLGREVRCATIERERWRETYVGLGFCEEAARSYEAMTAATLEGDFPAPEDVVRGATTLSRYFAERAGSA